MNVDGVYPITEEGLITIGGDSECEGAYRPCGHGGLQVLLDPDRRLARRDSVATQTAASEDSARSRKG